MYSQELGIRINESAQKHTREREEMAKMMRSGKPPIMPPAKSEKEDESGMLGGLIDKIGSEDIILVALIIFLLSDISKNDLLLVGILIYLLLF